MSTHIDPRTTSGSDTGKARTNPGAGRWAGGLVLILVGLLMLAGQYLGDSGLSILVLPALALILLVWGIAARHAGPIIPGCILAGIALGTILEDRLVLPAPEAHGGVILVSMALGFAAIMPLAAVVTGDRHWWGLIVGAILGLIGLALLIGGQAMQVLEVAGQAWPLVLIALGVYLIVEQRGARGGN